MKTRVTLSLCSLLLAAVFAVPGVVAQSDMKSVMKGRDVWNKKRCGACHGIGRLASGPDLIGLSGRRTAEWIYEWMNDSEKMLESDSTAKDLYSQYNRLVMPSMKLSKKDTDALMMFINYEEARIVKREGLGRAAGSAPQ